MRFLCFVGDEDYLILGCDGLWDMVDASSAVQLVDNFVLQGNDKTETAKMLVQEAKSRGSMDNISVIVVILNAQNKVRDAKVAPIPQQDS